MRKVAIIVVGLLQVAQVFAQQARILEGLSMSSSLSGQDIKYSVILPEDYYASKKSYPVVYLLHGLGDAGSSWLEYGRISQTVDLAVKRREIIPMIYVMPQGFRSYYVNDYAGKLKYEDMFIRELVPMIDKQYRTIADKGHRATMGYSMGGFGALVLPLRNPDVLTVSVPLSISVRTDEQYMTEEASGWDDQWGRLFGGEGTTGEARLTEYYKQHSPFYIFSQQDLSSLKDLKLYIDNGDDEETLCRSNEELHILLRDKNFPHEFRVRNGGHEFSYWRSALPNALHFISDSFEGKSYRGDVKSLSKPANVGKSSRMITTAQYDLLLPDEYDKTTRLYPVIYFSGNFDQHTKDRVASLISSSVSENLLPPMIAVFLKGNTSDLSGTIIPAIEKNYRARSGYRFRALIGFDKDGASALDQALVPETFTACALFDVPVNCDALKKTITENKKVLDRTWLFVCTTDKSANYRSNGCAHMLLRNEEIYHEYRVGEGKGGAAWFLENLPEVLDFAQRKIHR